MDATTRIGIASPECFYPSLRKEVIHNVANLDSKASHHDLQGSDTARGPSAVVADMIDTAAWVLGSARCRALAGDPVAQAELVVVALCDTLHGRGVYVPSGDSVRSGLLRHARDRRIRAEFDGRNHAELAQRYNLTPRTVRRILERGHGR